LPRLPRLVSCMSVSIAPLIFVKVLPWNED
jgi:hypothetical protein